MRMSAVVVHQPIKLVAQPAVRTRGNPRFKNGVVVPDRRRIDTPFSCVALPILDLLPITNRVTETVTGHTASSFQRTDLASGTSRVECLTFLPARKKDYGMSGGEWVKANKPFP